MNRDGPRELQRQLFACERIATATATARPRVVLDDELDIVEEAHDGQVRRRGREADNDAARSVHQVVGHVQVLDEHDLGVELERERLLGRAASVEHEGGVRMRVDGDIGALGGRVERLELAIVDEVHVVLVRAQLGGQYVLVGEHFALLALEQLDGAARALAHAYLLEHLDEHGVRLSLHLGNGWNW